MKNLIWMMLVMLVLCACGGEAPASDAAYDLTVPERAEEVVYGQSGGGRDLVAYRFGGGENVLVAGFALHGFEDGWERDGAALVYTAEQLMQRLDTELPEGWTVYVLPCMNPDGLLDGSTMNGPGRCTTTSLDEAGQLSTERGIDLNRSFPIGWAVQREARNYNGTRPLAAQESKALAQLLQAVRGTGKNVCLDVHGWYGQIITSDGPEGALWNCFCKGFPESEWADCTLGEGYFTAYAAFLGYDACLFEFPGDVSSQTEFEESGYWRSFCDCVLSLLQGETVG